MRSFFLLYTSSLYDRELEFLFQKLNDMNSNKKLNFNFGKICERKTAAVAAN